MALLNRGILRTDQADLRIFCLGLNYVGINITGTWAGTVAFSAGQQVFGYTGPSPGGGGFVATSVYPYNTSPSSANAVQSVTANGQWYWPVQNYSNFRALFTLTSGAPIIILAASLDSSYADAFLNPNAKFLSSVAGGSRNTLTIPADLVYGRRLINLVISAAAESGAGGSSVGPSNIIWQQNPILQIKDGTNVLWAQDLNTAVPFQYTVPLPANQQQVLGVTDGGLYFTPGNDGVITLSSPGVGGIITCLNATISAA